MNTATSFAFLSILFCSCSGTRFLSSSDDHAKIEIAYPLSMFIETKMEPAYISGVLQVCNKVKPCKELTIVSTHGGKVQIKITYDGITNSQRLLLLNNLEELDDTEVLSIDE